MNAFRIIEEKWVDLLLYIRLLYRESYRANSVFREY
jgi:hypothetical protein